MTALSIHTLTDMQPVQSSQVVTFPFPLAESLLDTEAQGRSQLDKLMVKIEGLNKTAEARRKADAERIVELEKALSLSEAQQRATVMAYGEQLKTQSELIKTLTEAMSVLRKEVTILKAREKTVEESLLACREVFNGHVHTYHLNCDPCAKTSSPGTKCFVGYPRMYDFTPQHFPKPQFDKERDEDCVLM